MVSENSSGKRGGISDSTVQGDTYAKISRAKIPKVRNYGKGERTNKGRAMVRPSEIERISIQRRGNVGNCKLLKFLNDGRIFRP